MDVSIVILAAGQGTRMKSKTPKILHPLAGKPMVEYALNNATGITNRLPVLVIGHGADEVRQKVGERAIYAVQEEQLGTAHAVACAENILKGFEGLILIFYADMPLLTTRNARRPGGYAGWQQWTFEHRNGAGGGSTRVWAGS